jgi:hypothetical protein
MATSTRIFSFGLGHAPSRSLVKGLARATNGRFVFIPPNSSVDTHVGEQLQKALQPCITNIKIRWNLNHPVMSVPTQPPPVYANDRLICYALLDTSTSAFDHNSIVELYADQQRIGEAKITQVPHISNDGTIARLAAKAIILELQHSKLPPKNTTGSLQARFKQIKSTPVSIIDEKDSTKKRIIELSLKYKILSPFTAFVGIEKRLNASNADMVLREVPIQISADDQQLRTLDLTATYCSSAAKCSMMPMPMNRSRTMSSLGFSRSRMPRMHSNFVPQQMYAGPQTMMANSYSASSALSDNGVCDEISSTTMRSMRVQCGSIVRAEREISEVVWPTGDENIVRYLISKQKFDGLWNLEAIDIERLTSKPITSFPQGHQDELLITAIVVVALETRFGSLSTLWHGVVQKARKHLINLVGNDVKKLDALFEKIRQQL